MTQATKIYGVDTETYREEESFGLKSIQLWGESENHYFTTDNWEQTDDEIRKEICNKFFTFLLFQPNDIELAFFNLSFDGSQFLKYLVTESGLRLSNGKWPKKGEFQILESDRKMYSITIRTKSNFIITMVDVANFLVGVNLDKASHDWLGRGKVEIETKKFPKQASTPKEIEYAMEDAHLTYDLYNILTENEVIESNTVTIAGRTIRHFQNFLYEKYNLSFDDYFYAGYEQEEIEQIKEQFEDEIRPGVRGGICQAWQRGVFQNCIHIDACSMYPTQCIRDYIPVGPLLSEPPKDKKYTKIVYPVGFYTLKDNRVPCVQWRTKAQCLRYRFDTEYECGEFVKDFFLDGSYPIWEEEYKIIKECYYVAQEEIEKVWYIEMHKNTILKKYVKILYEGKQNNTGSKRLYYKYLLNALYGKFLSRPDGTGIDYVMINNEWKRIKAETYKNTYYVPLGSWIATMGRVTLMKAIISVCDKYGADKFIYCDTDSMIIKKPAMADVSIGSYLGDWSIEQDNVTVNVIGPKTYQELTENGKLITKCGGLPTRDKNKLKWLELKDGLVVPTEKPRRDSETWAINFKPIEFTVNARTGAFIN